MTDPTPPHDQDDYDDLPTVPEFPTSLEPGEALEILVGELRTPVAAIEGWVQVLADDRNLEDISFEAVEAIPRLTAHLRAFLDSATRYLDQHDNTT